MGGAQAEGSWRIAVVCGVEWSGQEWTGVESTVVEWSVVDWSGVWWSGMDRTEVECSGVEVVCSGVELAWIEAVQRSEEHT